MTLKQATELPHSGIALVNIRTWRRNIAGELEWRVIGARRGLLIEVRWRWGRRLIEVFLPRSLWWHRGAARRVGERSVVVERGELTGAAAEALTVVQELLVTNTSGRNVGAVTVIAVVMVGVRIASSGQWSSVGVFKRTRRAWLVDDQLVETVRVPLAEISLGIVPVPVMRNLLGRVHLTFAHLLGRLRPT